MNKLLATTALILAAVSLPAFAQQAAAPATTPAAPAPAAAAPAAPASQTAVDPKLLGAAREVVKCFDMTNMLQSVFSIVAKTMLPLIARDNPNQTQQIQQIAVDSVRRVFMQHMDQMEENKAIVYAQIYNYDELVQLKAFYQSPLGKKTLSTMPDMMQKTMTLDQPIMIEAMQESKAALRDALRKNGMKVPKEMDL